MRDVQNTQVCREFLNARRNITVLSVSEGNQCRSVSFCHNSDVTLKETVTNQIRNIICKFLSGKSVFVLCCHCIQVLNEGISIRPSVFLRLLLRCLKSGQDSFIHFMYYVLKV